MAAGADEHARQATLKKSAAIPVKDQNRCSDLRRPAGTMSAAGHGIRQSESLVNDFHAGRAQLGSRTIAIARSSVDVMKPCIA
jgi:hypothetical protein